MISRHTIAKVGSNFRMTVVSAEDPGNPISSTCHNGRTMNLPRPLRPGVVPPTRDRWPGQQLEIRNRLRAVAHRGSDTIVSSVTTSDHDHVFAFRVDVVTVLKLRVKERLRVELRRLSTHVRHLHTRHTCKNSMAKCIPLTSRLGIFKSRGHVAPVQRTTASFSSRSVLASMSTPTFALETKVCKNM